MKMLFCKFQEMKHIDYSISILLLAASDVTVHLFILCFFGKVATENFSEMADCMFESNWLKFPVNLQKSLILMIENAQIPLCYNGYIVTLNLETYTKVSEIT